MRYHEAMHTGVADTGLSWETQDAIVYTITRNRVGESNSHTWKTDRKKTGKREVGKLRAGPQEVDVTGQDLSAMLCECYGT